MARRDPEDVETLRELWFKLRAANVMLVYAQLHLADEPNAVIDNGLARLALCHTRGEDPLQWEFEGLRVRASRKGTAAPAEVTRLKPL